MEELSYYIKLFLLIVIPLVIAVGAWMLLSPTDFWQRVSTYCFCGLIFVISFIAEAVAFS